MTIQVAPGSRAFQHTTGRSIQDASRRPRTLRDAPGRSQDVPGRFQQPAHTNPCMHARRHARTDARTHAHHSHPKLTALTPHSPHLRIPKKSALPVHMSSQVYHCKNHVFRTMLYLRFHCKLQGFLQVRRLSNHCSILAVFAENHVFYNENATTAMTPRTSTFEVFWLMPPGTPFEGPFYSFLYVFQSFFSNSMGKHILRGPAPSGSGVRWMWLKT